MSVLRWRKVWYALSGSLVLISLGFILAFGWNLSIDFTGGSVVEVAYTSERPALDAVRAVMGEGAVVQTVEPNGVLIRTVALTPEAHGELLEQLRGLGSLDERRFDAVGPSIGQELAKRAAWALIAVVVMIVCYVAWAFREVRGHVPSWKYGVLTVLAGLHDVIIPLGVFSALGHWQGVSIGTAFVAAVLTVLGYSVNDTIVIFDRVRERLHGHANTPFASVVEQSIRETWKRSINTTMTTLLALSAILFFGGQSTREFALALFIGIATGAYSSIFIAAPLLVSWEGKTEA
jgi:preprotein translocase subunit SecF